MDVLPLSILVVGTASDLGFVRDVLGGAPSLKFEIEHAPTVEEALELLSVPCHDVCVMVHPPGAPADLDVVRRARAAGCISPMILVGEGGGTPMTEAARRLGAMDYIDRERLDGVLLEHVLLHVLRYARAHESLRQAIRENGQLGAALAALPLGVVITDAELPDDPVVFVNPGFEALTGYTAAEIIGRNLRLLQGPGSDPAVVDEMRHAVAARRSVTRTLLSYRKDGTPFWNEMQIVPVFEEDGGCTSFVVLQRDVSAWREAQARLAQDERCIHGLVDRLAEAAGIRQGGRLVHANRALVRLLGVARAEDLEGRAVRALVRPEDRADLELRDGDGTECLASARHVRLVREDGRELLVEVRSAKVSYLGAPAVLDVLVPVAPDGARADGGLQ